MWIIQDKSKEAEISYQHGNGNGKHKLLCFRRAVDSRTYRSKERSVQQIAAKEIEQEIKNEITIGNFADHFHYLHGIWVLKLTIRILSTHVIHHLLLRHFQTKIAQHD